KRMCKRPVRVEVHVKHGSCGNGRIGACRNGYLSCFRVVCNGVCGEHDNVPEVVNLLYSATEKFIALQVPAEVNGGIDCKFRLRLILITPDFRLDECRIFYRSEQINRHVGWVIKKRNGRAQISPHFAG